MEKTELEKLKEENELLRQEYLKLKKQPHNTRKPLSKGCLTGLVVLVGGFVAIPILSIIAAIAFPAYQQFKTKAEFGTECVKLYEIALHVRTSYEAGSGLPYDLYTIGDVEKNYGLSFAGTVNQFEYFIDEQIASFIFHYSEGPLRSRVLTLKVNCQDGTCSPTIESSDLSLKPPPNPY